MARRVRRQKGWSWVIQAVDDGSLGTRRRVARAEDLENTRSREGIVPNFLLFTRYFCVKMSLNKQSVGVGQGVLTYRHTLGFSCDSVQNPRPTEPNSKVIPVVISADNKLVQS